jgi:phage-related protein
MAEQAYAYVTLIPVATGFQKAIAGEMGTAGAESAEVFGGGFNSKLGLVIAAGVAALGIGKLVADSINLASAFEAEFIGVEQVFGDAATVVQEFASKASKLIGTSETDALKAAKGLGVYGAAAGLAGDDLADFSVDLLQAAGDLGSFYDVSTEEALDAIGAGLRGEAEPLRKFGILMSDAALKAVALEEGIIKADVSLIDIEKATLKVTKAQDEYNKAVKDYGPDSLQAKEAQIKLTEATDDFEKASAGKIGALTAEEKILAANALIMDQLGAAQGDFTNYSDTYGNAIKTVTADFKDMQTQIGTALLPAAAAFATFAKDVLVPILTTVAQFISDNIAPITAFATTLGILTVAFNLQAIATAISTAAWWANATAILANPITWIVLGIAAVVAAIVYLATQTTFFTDIWEAMTKGVEWAWLNIFKPVIDALGEAWDWVYNNILLPVFDGILLAFGIMAGLVVAGYETLIKPMLDAFGAAFKWLYDNIIKPIGSFIGTAFNNIGEGFKATNENVIKPALDAFGKAFRWVYDNIVTPVADLITTAFETIGTTVQAIFEGVSKFVGDTFVGLVNIIRHPLNLIIEFINMVIDALNTIQVKIPSFVPKFGGQTFGINLPRVPSIPALAKGGFVDSPTTALIGEAGPEVVMPLDRFEKLLGLDSTDRGKTLNYYAAPNQSLDEEQALFLAMKRARVVANW